MRLNPRNLINLVILSRPGRSQGLLYKHLRQLIKSVMICENIFTASLRPKGCRWCFQAYKFLGNLNPEGHPNFINGSKVTAILLNGAILPIDGATLGRVCACSLRSRLVSLALVWKWVQIPPWSRAEQCSKHMYMGSR